MTETPIMLKPRWPEYAFGRYAGPVHRVFAWYPVRLWYGRWTWLRPVLRIRVIKIAALPGPDWAFWCYNDVPSELHTETETEDAQGARCERAGSASA